jgi:hypothetical protein
VLREELSRLFTFEERHRRLLARLVLAFSMSVVVFALGTVLIWLLESGRKDGDINGFGDAAFFTAVQLLTVSSSIKNPLTAVRQDCGCRPRGVGCLRHHRSRRQLRQLLYLRRLELVAQGASRRPVGRHTGPTPVPECSVAATSSDRSCSDRS